MWDILARLLRVHALRTNRSRHAWGSSRRCRPSVEALEARISPATLTWNGQTGDNQWSNKFNWDMVAGVFRVPLPRDDVRIPRRTDTCIEHGVVFIEDLDVAGVLRLNGEIDVLPAITSNSGTIWIDTGGHLNSFGGLSNSGSVIFNGAGTIATGANRFVNTANAQISVLTTSPVSIFGEVMNSGDLNLDARGFTSLTISGTFTQTKNASMEIGVQLTPNPKSDMLNLEGAGSSLAGRLFVTSISGQTKGALPDIRAAPTKRQV
jgi:hypothetical protein